MVLNLSFQCECPLLLFSCLIVLANTPNIMLHKSGKSEHPFLFIVLDEKLSDFNTDYGYTIGWQKMVFIMLINIPSIFTLLKL